METKVCTVLMVDNSPLERSQICDGLKKLGDDVFEADSGMQALDILNRQSIDVVVVELDIPDMDGFDLLSAMKSDSVLHTIPVIVVSDADDMESVVRAIDMGAVDHLSKPLEAVLLNSQIRAAVAIKQEAERPRGIPGPERVSVGAVTCPVNGIA